MDGVAVIGEELLVQGFGLVGATVLPADGPDPVRAAWRDLPDDVTLVILTAAAAAALDLPGPGTRAGGELRADGPLVVVMT